jgi:hypothetical protein
MAAALMGEREQQQHRWDVMAAGGSTSAGCEGRAPSTALVRLFVGSSPNRTYL